jgi:thiamine transport system ATP-binding protein
VLKAELVLDVQLLLREAGVTVLAVTHDRHEAFTLADRVAVLREGQLVQVATPAELWERPIDGYVARLVGLSVLDGVAYPPDGLRNSPSGRWQLRVTGHAFSAGHYLVSGLVSGSPVTYVHAGPLPEVGATIGLDPV